MNKLHFFGKFFLNTAYTVLFSQAAILFAILIVSLRNPVANFFFTTFLMSAMLIFRFYREGYGEIPSERAGFIGFILGSLPTWAFFSILQTLAVFAFNTQVSGNGVFSLALILSGNFKANALRVGKMPEGVAPAFALSLIINAALYTALAYIGYKFGIMRREAERRNTLNGSTAELEFYKKLPLYSCYIPLWNFATIFPWVLSYLVMPERKLSRFFKKILLMFAALLFMRFLHTSFYLICPVEWAYWIFFAVTLHVFCIACALIAYRDEQNYSSGGNNDSKR